MEMMAGVRVSVLRREVCKDRFAPSKNAWRFPHAVGFAAPLMCRRGAVLLPWRANGLSQGLPSHRYDQGLEFVETFLPLQSFCSIGIIMFLQFGLCTDVQTKQPPPPPSFYPTKYFQERELIVHGHHHDVSITTYTFNRQRK